MSDVFGDDVWAGPVLDRSLSLFLRGLVSAFLLMMAITRSLMQSSSFLVVSLPTRCNATSESSCRLWECDLGALTHRSLRLLS